MPMDEVLKYLGTRKQQEISQKVHNLHYPIKFHSRCRHYRLAYYQLTAKGTNKTTKRTS